VEQKENNIVEMLSVTDLKIWGLNSFAIAMNFMNIESSLSMLLSIIAIGYTLHKWYLMYNRNKRNK
jgi:hypothetical protein